ncbi:hypothetical protein NIES4101_27960 (plasmid) [Calothrix sp. NIES-4101]|nr:hypothetical protein NIES4101_27960 [Calothrix sp. NIES-4101]
MSKNNGGFQFTGWGLIGLLALLGIGGIIFFQSNISNLNLNQNNSPGGNQQVNTGSGSIHESKPPSTK